MASVMTMLDRLSAAPDADPAGNPDFAPDRPLGQDGLRPGTLLVAIWRGVRGRCPACGCGKLFRAFLKPVPACAACSEDWLAQASDDFPPYVVILLLGHVIAPGMIALETLVHPPLWVHLIIWMPLAVILAISLIQPVKGGVMALQWWHGARPRDAPDEGGGAGSAPGSSTEN